jgi:hypothetical protein
MTLGFGIRLQIWCTIGQKMVNPKYDQDGLKKAGGTAAGGRKFFDRKRGHLSAILDIVNNLGTRVNMLAS